jgi:hypothetical protein
VIKQLENRKRDSGNWWSDRRVEWGINNNNKMLLHFDVWLWRLSGADVGIDDLCSW